MVTHDVGLKYYGDRVVRMVDGKINKIEDISPEERREIKSKLRARIEDKQSGLREGISAEAVGQIESSSSNTKTFIRKVTDYKIKTFK
jgi:hypothetical protein